MYAVVTAYIPGKGWACLFTPAAVVAGTTATPPPHLPTTLTLTVQLLHNKLPGGSMLTSAVALTRDLNPTNLTVIVLLPRIARCLMISPF